ncbi:sugar transferase [Treponema pectinovorum]|uniref:sugar transferase n=1 Tax=Treponema pectinovorum TaxID=164 RepID=UPI0011CA6194|nr:sugar transferase [Treponema pectinovorum]
MQRFFDVLFSGIAIILLSPLFLVTMIILKCTGEHEIFYLQQRMGKKNTPFYIIKFATMLKNSINMGAGDVTVRNDPRILPFGKFLRKTKINELPQLFNIFIGQMSIVGWRPLVIDSYEMYTDEVKKYISTVSPGLSGVGSIIFRDEESYYQDLDNPKIFYDEVIRPYKGKCEIWYVKNRSIMLYFKVIILTVISVVNPKSNIYIKWFKNLPKRPTELPL